MGTSPAVGGGGGQADLTVLLGLLIGNVGEVAGDGVVGLTGPADQVQGHHGELAGGAALEEENLVVVGHLEQLAEARLGVLKDLQENLRSVTHLHH